LPELFVIDRGSTFSYKGKAVNARQVGSELGVKYLLEGSARKATDRVRINVQLVDATTGEQLWAQRYDEQTRDIFALEDEIVRSLLTTLDLQLDLLRHGYGRVPQRTKNLEAYDYYLRGVEVFFVTYFVKSPGPDGLAEARKMFEKAVELDPNYADAYASLGFLDWVAYAWQWDRTAGVLGRATALASKAIALDHSNSLAYQVRGWVAATQARREQALGDAERAVLVDPNSAGAWAARADINSILGGEPQNTLIYVQRAKRLDPRHPETGCLQEGSAYNSMGRYAEAIEALKICEQNNPWSHLGLVVAYSKLGRQQEAQAEAAEILRVSPGFTLEKLRQTIPRDWRNPGERQFLADLRKAGIN
jgi:adenylate cyclase